jgi:type II secretory ATPase GspE/PulE/Tfp pilus assembly ATPase PilB-like protein
MQTLHMRTLREDGLEKAKQGLTSVEEVLRVTAGEISD